jgi:hypothetical protein
VIVNLRVMVNRFFFSAFLEIFLQTSLVTCELHGYTCILGCKDSCKNYGNGRVTQVLQPKL